MKRLFLAGAALLSLVFSAHADPLDIFRPTGYAITPLAVDTSGETSVIPGGTQSLLVQNGGTDTVYCQPGATATVAAVQLQSGQNYIFPLNGQTSIACIAAATTATVNLIPGSGYAFSGGGGGGSSGGTVPNPIGVTQSTSPWVVSGTVTANAGTNLNTSALATSANQTTELSDLATIATNTGSSVPAGANNIGTVSADPCAYNKKTFVEFSTATGTATNLISAVASQFVYICEVTITTSAQTNFSLTASTTTACAGSPYAVMGSTTAASGLLLGPGVSTAGGIVLGNGGYTIGVAGTANSYVCTLFTTTNSPTVTGHIGYVQTAS